MPRCFYRESRPTLEQDSFFGGMPVNLKCYLSMSVVLVTTIVAIPVAATIIVQQDGSGDFTTIYAAVVAASPGELIQVGPGVYAESLLITKSVDIASLGGADVTVLDGEDTRDIMQIDGSHNVGLSGLTFTRAFAPDQAHGAALLAWNGPTVSVEDCVFTDNVAGWDNGAVHARHAGTYVTLTRCHFENNFAGHNGGACGVHTFATMRIDECVFIDNHTSGIAGACNAYNFGVFDISGSLFVGNTADTGAIIVENSAATISGNTFHGNSSPGHASVLFSTATAATFDHNIVTSDVGGAGIEFLNCVGGHSCNVYFGNDAGDILGGEIDESEIVADPQFCDYTTGDFMLCMTSPAAAENNTCGLIGAFGIGCDVCGPVRIESKTWSEIRAVFR